MFISVTTNPTHIQKNSVEDKNSTSVQKVTLEKSESKNTSLISKICILIPAFSMTSNLPMIPFFKAEL